MAGSVVVELAGSTAVGNAVTLEIRRIIGVRDKASIVGVVGLILLGW
jgi:hypothetical protein